MAKLVFTFEDTVIDGIPAMKGDFVHDVDLNDPNGKVTPAILVAAMVVELLQQLDAMSHELLKAQQTAGKQAVDDLLKSFKPAGKAN